MAKKIFVLRPHAVLSSDGSLLGFGSDNIVVIPLAVMDEIQSMKNLLPEKAKIRGAVLRYLRYAAQNGALTKEGYTQENGSILRIEPNNQEAEVPLSNLTDYQIRTLKVCLGLMKSLEKGGEGEQVILITNNSTLQVKAQLLGIKAEYFKDEIFPELSQQYTGTMELHVGKDIFDRLYKNESIPASEVSNFSTENLYQNAFLIIKEKSRTLFAQLVDDKIVPHTDAYNLHSFGLKPRNDAQRLLMMALKSDCQLIIARGAAGVGKTILSLADALDRYENGEYRKIYVSSPTFNEKNGYLPGDIHEKNLPFISGIMDNLEFLLAGRRNDQESEGKDSDKTEKNGKKKLAFKPYRQRMVDTEKPEQESGEYFFERGILEIRGLDYLRGASINTLFIIDEAQNTRPDQMKTILTRMAEGSRFIILGDPTQVDDPALDSRYNGLVYAAEGMKGCNGCVIVTLDEQDSVRCELAKEAAMRLGKTMNAKKKMGKESDENK